MANEQFPTFKKIVKFGPEISLGGRIGQVQVAQAALILQDLTGGDRIMDLEPPPPETHDYMMWGGTEPYAQRILYEYPRHNVVEISHPVNYPSSQTRYGSTEDFARTRITANKFGCSQIEFRDAIYRKTSLIFIVDPKIRYDNGSEQKDDEKFTVGEDVWYTFYAALGLQDITWTYSAIGGPSLIEFPDGNKTTFDPPGPPPPIESHTVKGHRIRVRGLAAGSSGAPGIQVTGLLGTSASFEFEVSA